MHGLGVASLCVEGDCMDRFQGATPVGCAAGWSVGWIGFRGWVSWGWGVRRPFDVRIVYRIFECSVGCLGGWSVGCGADLSVGCVAALSIRFVAEFVGWVYGWIV